MPSLLLYNIIAFIPLILLICFLESFIKTFILFLTLWICCVVWTISVQFQPAKIDKILLLEPILVESTQIISYEDWQGLKIVNLNKKLERYIPEGCKVEVTIYKRDYYLGIWYNDVASMPDTYKVVCNICGQQN